MDFSEHRAASIIVEFDDARAEKLKKNQTSTIQIFFNFSQNVDKDAQKQLARTSLSSNSDINKNITVSYFLLQFT